MGPWENRPATGRDLSSAPVATTRDDFAANLLPTRRHLPSSLDVIYPVAVDSQNLTDFIFGGQVALSRS